MGQQTQSGSKSPSSNTKQAAPLLSNNSAAVSPEFRSISSSSISSDESLSRRESNNSKLSKKSVGGYSQQLDNIGRKDSFSSSGMLAELAKVRRQCHECSEEVESGGCTAN